MPRPLIVLVALLGSFGLVTGCNAFGSDDDEQVWVEREMEAPSETVAWQVVLRSLNKLDYPIGSGIQPDRLSAETGWRTSLAPFKDEGFRLRATVVVEPLGEDRFNFRVRVERERNRSLVNPSDLRYAEWEGQPDDELEAQIVMQHLRSYLDSELPVKNR